MQRYDRVENRSWTFTDSDVYEEAWKSERGDLLYVEDALSGKLQPSLRDFAEPRYHVNLQERYRPRDEPVHINAFYSEEEAAALVRSLTYPG